MPRRVSTSARRRRPRRGGASLRNLAKRANNWLKETKVVSRVAKALDDSGVKYAGTIGRAAEAAGYGRRYRRSRRVRGGSLRDIVMKVNNWLRKTGAVSKVASALDQAGVPFAGKIASVAKAGGYRRPARRRIMRGGAMPIGLPAGVPQGTPMAYYPYATNMSRAHF